MKIILLIFFCVNFLLPGLTQDIFKELKGEHFIVNYYPGHISFAQKVLTHAEQYYVTIANDLGYSRYSKFWLWNNRVTIYIYPDHASYLKAAHMPSWSNGMADYKNKIIKSYFRGKGFLISILPHEITHLIFRDFVGFTGKIPLWLDEGLAQWEEPLKRKRIKYSMRDIFKRKMILPLSEMMKMDIRNIKSDNKISIRYINDKGKDRKSTRLNSSHTDISRMPSSA